MWEGVVSNKPHDTVGFEPEVDIKLNGTVQSWGPRRGDVEVDMQPTVTGDLWDEKCL